MENNWEEVTDNTIAPNENTVIENKVITKVYSIFSDSISIYENWMFYMIDKEFDRELELRNKVGIIILGSLFDILSYEKLINIYRLEAKSVGLTHLESYFNLIDNYINSVKEFLEIYTKQEQVFISYQRNQLVHSFLKGRLSDDKIGVKYVNNGKFINNEKMDIKEFHNEMEKIYKSGTVDTILNNLVNKWFESNSRYISHISGFIKHKKEIYESIYKKIPISISYSD